jgi:GT2 family glycosyltransferase
MCAAVGRSSGSPAKRLPQAVGTLGIRAMDDRQQSAIKFPPTTGDEPLTVAILNYNGKHVLGDAIASVQASTYAPFEILVVDDGSTDGSASFVTQNFPEVRVVELGRNTRRLNHVRNRALNEAKTRLVFLMDNDVVLEPSCLSVLVSQMRALPNSAVLTTRAVFQSDPERIYVDAQGMHFLCNTVALTRDGDLSAAAEDPRPSVGWGTQLIDKLKASVIGFFDEDYVMGWGDDGEFHQKIHLAGLGCYSVPKALVYHKREAGSDRIYGGVRNRWSLIIETYAVRSLLVLAPVLVLYEIALFSFLCLKGRWREYLGAMTDVVASLPRLLTNRSRVQNLRASADRDLLMGGPIYIRGSLVARKSLQLGMNLLNQVFEGYWKVARKLI